MIAATLKEQKKAKIRFFALYIASVVLIIVIVSSLWKDDSPAMVVSGMEATSPTKNERLLQIDALLHNKLEIVDNEYASAISAGKAGMQSRQNNLQSAESNFRTTLDSLDKEAATIKDEQQKSSLMTLVADFRKSLESRSKLMNGYTTLLNDTTNTAVGITGATGTTDAEMQELKTILVEKEEKVAALEKKRLDDLAEKDKIITSLQSQVAKKTNGPVQTPTTSGDSEWKQKYVKLKASYDNVAGQNNTLSRSYKSIVDDNRRLLSQLQAARKQ
ncbi:MAG: hypothetical protein JWR72_3251 [Flavisolibacter sp.]|nr:hypothetical protein [Flavisolibacter sp.]